MGQMLIRRLDDDVLDRLRARARENNRSVEAEARTILGEVLAPEPPRPRLSDFIGIVPTGRTQAEIDADVTALRDEWDDR
jgi:antitoxin FitA